MLLLYNIIYHTFVAFLELLSFSQFFSICQFICFIFVYFILNMFFFLFTNFLFPMWNKMMLFTYLFRLIWFNYEPLKIVTRFFEYFNFLSNSSAILNLVPLWILIVLISYFSSLSTIRPSRWNTRFVHLLRFWSVVFLYSR